MAPSFFSKDFWSKRRKIIAGLLAGVSIAAVVIAVPVALTTGKGSTAVVAPETSPEVREVQDEQNNQAYTKSIVYGSPVDALKEMAPALVPL